MAGRAGRRGLDTIGYVILLPNMYNLPSIMNSLLTHGSQNIESKLKPTYNLIFRLLNSENLEEKIDFSLIFENSLKTSEEMKRIKNLRIEYEKKEIPGIEKFNEIIEYERLMQVTLDGFIKLSNTTIKKNQTKAKLISSKPDFKSLYKEYLLIKKDLIEKNKILKEIEEIEREKPLYRMFRRQLKFLKDLNYIDEEDKLTKKGKMAEFYHECHPVLITEIISRNLIEYDINSLIEFFSLFTESKMEMVPNKKYKEIYEITNELSEMEKKNEIINTIEKWEISTELINPINEWINGEDFNKIMTKYGLFEGNFIKEIYKICNISAECQLMAEYIENYELAMNCKKVYELLNKDLLKVNSLYIVT